MQPNNTQVTLEQGFDPLNGECIMQSTSAVTYGDIVMVDKATVNSSSKRWYKVATPTTAQLIVGFFMVCLEQSVAAGAWGRFGVVGLFEVNATGITLTDPPGGDGIFTATNGTNVVSEVAATAATTNTATTVANYKIIAQSTTALRALSNGDSVAWAYFDGINGIGSMHVVVS